MKQVRSQSPEQAIIDQELRLLARVTSALSEISSRNAGTPDFDAALVTLRDQIAESKPEDIPALVEQMMRISAIAQRYGKGADLPVDPGTPYFAHMRLEEEERLRDVMIGKHGFVDRDRGVLIVDWRHAPVSRLYYRYEEGDDFEEQFGNVSLEGWVRARRNLTIEEGQIERIGCPQGTFIPASPGAWQQLEATPLSELGGGQGKAARPFVQRGRAGARLGIEADKNLKNNKHLPEIAALIDPEQFALITRPESGLVVLQGGAGSGKTTVALHRVAYLNYRMPGRFKANQMLVLVPTEAMKRYVRQVLPSLRVKKVPVRTTEGWFAGLRRRMVPGAPNGRTDETPAEVLRVKKHPMLLEMAREFVERQVAELGQAMARQLSVAEHGDRVAAQWDNLADKPPLLRCARLRRWLDRGKGLNRVTIQAARAAVRRMEKRLLDVLADWGELLTDRGLLQAAVREHCPGEFSERQIRNVTRWCALQLEMPAEPQPGNQPSRRKPANSGGAGVDPFVSLDGRDERSPKKRGVLDPPDDALLLYLSLLKRGTLKPRGSGPVRYEHLVVDEAQDLSVVELTVLLACTTDLHSVTLAGDTAQRTVFDNQFSDWESLLARIDAPQAICRTLRLGYRSTEPIMALASHLVGDTIPTQDIRATRGGTPVGLHRFSDQGQAVAMLAEALRSLALREPRASVALIARHPEQARSYARALTNSEVPGIRLVRRGDFAFRPGFEVSDVTQVKGLEFDYVILLDVTAANYPDTTESRHLLHIGATRAAHQLWVVAVGTPSPLLPEMSG